MFNPSTNTNTPQPPYVEQLVVSVVEGLEKLAAILPYEFDETIDTIEGLYALKFQKPEYEQESAEKTAEELVQEYIEKSGKGEARRIVELNKEGR